MLISASRRTDIPAFYSRWLMNRLQAGFADVVNPFNPNQVKRVDLRPESVEAIIFWTRHPRPLFRHLNQIEKMGYRFYFLYTITCYPRQLEENLPSSKTATEIFKRLSDRLGPDLVIWRYDPIVLTLFTDADFQRRNFEGLSRTLSGHTNHVIISFVDLYRKVKPRLKDIVMNGDVTWEDIETSAAAYKDLARDLRHMAEAQGLRMQSCAEDIDLSGAGITPGKCIDDELISRIAAREIVYEKDPHQREHCLCTRSLDIGAYDTCGYRCLYCYANSSFETSLRKLKSIDVNSSSLAPARMEMYQFS